jgi:hypothetical protein
LTQPPTEMSTRKLPGAAGRLARKADNLTAICEPFVQEMWDPRRLTTLQASTACYRNVIKTWWVGGTAPPFFKSAPDGGE